MNAQALIRKIQAQRETWLELEPAVAPAGDDHPGQPAKRVLLRRPAEAEMYGVIHRGSRLSSATTCVVGWEGFREQDLLPGGIGGSDVVPFDAELWAEVLVDRGDWLVTISDKIIVLIKDHRDRKAAAEKN